MHACGIPTAAILACMAAYLPHIAGVPCGLPTAAVANIPIPTWLLCLLHIASYCTHVGKPEPIMLKSSSIILSNNSKKVTYIILFLFSYGTYFLILFFIIAGSYANSKKHGQDMFNWHH